MRDCDKLSAMTVTLELKPEIEASLAKQAAAEGVSVEEYIQSILESITFAPAPATRQERARLFEEWIKSHSHLEAAPLSDEAISREGIYREREDRQL
ncbi:MAG: hypothetical protein L0229_29485 [Blastocatellia bacterium]|nr:hypothetical protein [Blastocatellia bacterium]